MDVSTWARVSLDKAFTAEAYALLLALEQIEKDHFSKDQPNILQLLAF